ncbi:MAG: glycosyltransferase family 9 protein [Dehalococcoidia bacterium]|nr:glycosyltransferase family 9 protein [Dehalococcoidia bacterium]
MVRKRRYGFVKPHLVALFTVVDGLGSLVAAVTRLPDRRRWPHDPRRILLVNFGHIGDLLMITPVLRFLRANYPAAKIAVLAGPWSKDVLAACPYLDEILVFRPSWWDRQNAAYHRLSELLALVKLLRRGRFDLSVNFKSFLQENLCLWLARIPVRVGYSIYGGGFFLTRQVEYNWRAHTVEQNMALVAAARPVGESLADSLPVMPMATDNRVRLAWNCPPEAPAKASASLPPALDVEALAGFGPYANHLKPEMFVFEEDLVAAMDFLRANLGGEPLAEDPVPPLIAFHIGAGYPSKLWGEEKYAALADVLATKWGARILVVGGPDDVELIGRMQNLCYARLIVAAGRLSIRQMAAVLAHCRLFVGNDSGPAHIAAAIGLPTVAIFSGENDASVWRPYADSSVVIQHRPVCYPCGKRNCDRDHECMAKITVEEVSACVEKCFGPVLPQDGRHST